MDGNYRLVELQDGQTKTLLQVPVNASMVSLHKLWKNRRSIQTGMLATEKTFAEWLVHRSYAFVVQPESFVVPTE